MNYISRVFKKVMSNGRFLLLAAYSFTTVAILYTLIQYDVPPWILSIYLFFFVAFVLHAYSLKSKVIDDTVEIGKLTELTQEQEATGKALMKQDLELAAANEELRQIDAVKSEFVSVAAHQLRTPLSGIKWTLNVLMGEDAGPLTNDQRSLLSKIYESNEHMVNLVNNILDADRIQSGTIKFSSVEVYLYDIVDEVLFQLQPQVREKKISVEVINRNDESLPKVKVDPDKIKAVLQNLLENSLKYTKEEGCVTIELKKKEDEVLVTIADDGIGIPSGQRSKIFSRFFRASNVVKVHTNGSGLGLFIVKEIIERHGGKIWFESEEGKGTVFYFTLPLHI